MDNPTSLDERDRTLAFLKDWGPLLLTAPVAVVVLVAVTGGGLFAEEPSPIRELVAATLSTAVLSFGATFSKWPAPRAQNWVAHILAGAAILLSCASFIARLAT